MKKRSVVLGVLIGILLVFGLELYCAYVALSQYSVPPPRALGNDAGVIRRISQPDPSVGLSFAVIGDIHGGFDIFDLALQRVLDFDDGRRVWSLFASAAATPQPPPTAR